MGTWPSGVDELQHSILGKMRPDKGDGYTPPGYDPSTWTQITSDMPEKSGEWLMDPDGNKWRAHPEDLKHWRHWDIHDKNGNRTGRWPRNSGKPRKYQKRIRDRHAQSWEDPSGDAPEYKPGYNMDTMFVFGPVPLPSIFRVPMPSISPIPFLVPVLP